MQQRTFRITQVGDSISCIVLNLARREVSVIELSVLSQMIPEFGNYIKDPWNRVDQAMYIILLLAVILRFTLSENDFVGARYVYAINLVMFYLRILQLYYIHRRLGPKVVVIWRMVGVTADENRKLNRLTFFTQIYRTRKSAYRIYFN